MKKRWRNYTLIICITLMVVGSWFPTTMVLAASEQDQAEAFFKAYDLKDHSRVVTSSNVSDSPGHVYTFTDKPISLTGVERSYDFFYYVPKADLGKENFLQIEFSPSELLISSQSTLTVLVNDKPIGSVFLNEDGADNKIVAPLEEDELIPGYHKVTIVKHSLVSDDLCTDLYNPANWLRIEPTSFVYLDTKETWEMNDLLKDYPFPFLERGTAEELYGVIVVPDSPSDWVISAALQLAASFSLNTATGKTMPIMTESEWTKTKGKSHVIALGSIGDWQGAVKTIIEDNKIAVGEGLFLNYFALESDSSNKAEQLLLLVSGETDAVIQENIAVLTDSLWSTSLSGNQLTIQELPHKTSDVTEKQKTLSSFGYGNLLLDSVNRESQTMFIRFPSYWKMGDERIFELRLRVSPLLQQRAEEELKDALHHQYGLTLYLNDIPKTISLDELESADGDTYKVDIPLNEYMTEENNGVLELKFAASIDDTGGVCYRNRDEGRWIFVDKESTFQIPYEITKETSFRYWPAPFVNEEGLDQTAILIPEQVDGKLLTQLSMLVKELVTDTQNQEAPVIISNLEGAGEELKKYNIIMLGDPEQYTYVDGNWDQLLIQKQENRLQLSKFQVMPETTAHVAWIQPSIWNEKYSMLVLQQAEGVEQGDVSFYHSDMLQFVRQEQADSQILIRSKGNAIHSVLLNREVQTSAEGISLEVVGESSAVPIWVFLVIAAVFIVILLVLARLWRRKQRNE